MKYRDERKLKQKITLNYAQVFWRVALVLNVIVSIATFVQVNNTYSKFNSNYSIIIAYQPDVNHLLKENNNEEQKIHP